jgi:hypothetical protein
MGETNELESFPIEDDNTVIDIVEGCPPAEEIVDEPPMLVPSPSTTEKSTA